MIIESRAIGSIMGPTCAAVKPVEEVVGLALPGGAQGVGRVLPPVQRPLSSSGQSAAARVRDRDGRAPVARAVQRAEPSPAGSLEFLTDIQLFLQQCFADLPRRRRYRKKLICQVFLLLL